MDGVGDFLRRVGLGVEGDSAACGVSFVADDVRRVGLVGRFDLWSAATADDALSLRSRRRRIVRRRFW